MLEKYDTAEPDSFDSVKIKANQLEYLHMYYVPGQDEITAHSYERYIKDKEFNDPKIASVYEKSVSDIEKELLSLPVNERGNLILLSLESSLLVRKNAAGLIYLVPEGERFTLIEKYLEDSDPEVRRIAVSMVWTADIEMQYDLVKKAMCDIDPKVRKKAASRIRNIPESSRSKIISIALHDENESVRREGAWSIFSAPEELRFGFIEQILNNESSIEVKKEAVKRIETVHLDKRADLIILGLSCLSEDVYVDIIEKIWCVPKHDRSKVLDYIKKEKPELLEKIINIIEKNDNKNVEELLHSQLYKNYNINKEEFSRQNFNKTGSELTLVGGSLMGKSVIRHLTPRAFLAWQKIYENYKLWSESGFNYVPIEPIYSYNINNKGLVDIFSGVLDINLETWLGNTDMFKEELINQRDKIKTVLHKINFIHGHDHNSNFCLRFFRDGDNNIDFNQPPRLYLIDFDKAVI